LLGSLIGKGIVSGKANMISFSFAHLRAFLLIVIVCAFLFFHLHTIGLEDYWSDEILTYKVAKLPTPAAIWGQLKYSDGHPPLYFLAAHYFLRFAEARGINLRWLSVFWALVGMVGFYLWIQWSFGTRVSFLSSILLAINPLWLAFCQELRMYTMYPAFLWWAAGVLALAIRSRKRRWFLISALLNAAALWVHYHAAFFIGAEVIALVAFALHTRQRSLRGPILFFMGVILLCSLPLVGLIVSQSVLHRISWLRSPAWYGLFTCFFEAYFLFTAASIAQSGQQLIRYSVPLFFILVIVVLCIQAKKREASYDCSALSISSFPLVLLTATAFLPVSLMFFISFSPLKFFFPWRYSILSLGPFLGLVALIYSRIRSSSVRCAFVLYLLCIAGLSNWLLVTHREKPDWKALATVIDQHVTDQDILVFPPYNWGDSYLYYSSQKHAFTTFHDLMLESPHKSTTLYHLVYNYCTSDDPFYPWITDEFMSQKMETFGSLCRCMV
jgi:uncharacterized membrane protein